MNEATKCYQCNEPVTVPGAVYCCERCGEQHVIDGMRVEAGLPPLYDKTSEWILIKL